MMLHMMLHLLLFAFLPSSIDAFSAVPVSSSSTTRQPRTSFVLSAGNDDKDWIHLAEDGGVCKRIIEEGSGDPYASGTSVTTSYTGTLGNGDGWNCDEVVQCWLLEQQGLDHLADGFASENINEVMLTDTDTTFTEDFIKDKLGVENKIACKKLVMAAKRLAKTRAEYADGMEFDSSDSYNFVLGSGKVIRGMELGVSSMRAGEVAELRIRSDYAYGPEGYRKSNGDVLVPPFATLLFHIKLQ
jgi:hypothetical protein